MIAAPLTRGPEPGLQAFSDARYSFRSFVRRSAWSFCIGAESGPPGRPRPSCTSTDRRASAQPVVLQLTPQRGAGDAERVSGPRVIPPAALERLDDVRALDLGEVLLDGERRRGPQAG